MRYIVKLFKVVAVEISFLAFLMGLCSLSIAGTISLDFNTLPSAQGWIYVSDGAPETSIFSVSGGVLTQNTLAGPYSTEGYNLFAVIDSSLPFTISIRARVLAESGSPSTNSFGFGFGGRTGTETFLIGLGTDRIEDVLCNVLSTSIDNTQFHDYRLEVTPGIGYKFFVDNVLIATGLPRSNTDPNALLLGDLTRGTGAHAEVRSFTFCQYTEVDIDIKPGSFPNSINPKSKGKIPVAILTNETFDATTVDPTTVRFGKTGTEAAPVHSAFEDVNGDGDMDMILHFNTQETGIQCGDTSPSLTGETFSGQAIEGFDSIKTAGCK